MSVKHAFASPVAATTSTTDVDGPRWNENHLTPPFAVPLLLQHGAVAWTNIPAALTEWNAANRTRCKLDLTQVDEARVTVAVSVVANAAALVRVQYATDGDTQAAWAYLDGASGPSVSIAALGGAASPWVALAAGAKADVWVRAVGISGDGVADPVVGNITLHLR